MIRRDRSRKGRIQARPGTTGKPLVYISHGTNDGVLPIAPCSRRIVPQLARRQYEVTYREFEGEHTVPDTISKEAVQWFLE